jgi:hypothetical protein
MMSACNSSSAPTTASKLTVVQIAVKEKLRDPGSAEFSEQKIGAYQGHEVVCGKVNSKNGFGGMTGFQRFVSNGGEATVLEEQMKSEEFETVRVSMCS